MIHVCVIYLHLPYKSTIHVGKYASRIRHGFDTKLPKEMLLRMPLQDSEEDQFPPCDIDDGDAEGFLHLMHRRRLTALQLVGPAVPWVKVRQWKKVDKFRLYIYLVKL